MSSLRIFDFGDSSNTGRKRKEMEQPSSGNKGKEKIGEPSAAGEPKKPWFKEGERRKRFRTMFTHLQAMLPQLPEKTDRNTIVDGAISYIKTLENILQTLQEKKVQMQQSAIAAHFGQSLVQQPYISREAFLAAQGPSEQYNLSVPYFPPTFGTWISPNLVLNLCGNDAQINICSLRKPGMLTMFVQTLGKYNIEVVSAHVSSNHYYTMYMIFARAAGGICNVFSVKDIVLVAAEEIKLLASF